MATGSYLSVITLNVNGLNAPTKRQRLAELIQKQDPYICCPQETHLKTRDTYRLKVKGWEKVFHANGDQKKAGITILKSDKINFEIKTVKRDKVFDCMDHNKLWEILKEMGIPDHPTCLLKNLYTGQEATVRTGHETTD